MFNRLPVNELFDTLQGEATFTGTPATFVRLQGCSVGCPWCDTKHTWHLDPAHEIEPETMLRKTGDGPGYARMSAGEIADECERRGARHVVITGGEPCAYDLEDLTGELIARKIRPQIETSGTYQVRVQPMAFVTVSPKIGMPGGLEVRPDALSRANEIKMPVGKWADVEKLILLIRPVRPMAAIYLQPLSQSRKATEVCIEAAREHGWRVSLQAHKFAGLR